MQYSFSVFASTDIGLGETGFGDGTYTIGATTRTLVVEDNDGILSDEAGTIQDETTVMDTTGEMLDLVSQTVVGDIDGLGADGHVVQSVYKFTVYNATTGQTGTAYMLRLYNTTDPSTFQDSQGDGQLGPYYYALTIPFTVGDEITLSNGNYVGQVLYSDLSGGAPICFTAGTRIATPGGEVPVELLRPGTEVLTQSGRATTVRWVGIRAISGAQLASDPRLCPIEIAAGALGGGLPRRALRVSQQHRMLVRSTVAQRMTGSAEVLIPACHLLGLPGITRLNDTGRVVYVHFLCDQHEIVLAEGAPAETLLAGPMALQSMSSQARAEIARLMPDAPMLPARPLLAGKPARKLLKHHSQNGHPPLAMPPPEAAFVTTDAKSWTERRAA